MQIQTQCKITHELNYLSSGINDHILSGLNALTSLCLCKVKTKLYLELYWLVLTAQGQAQKQFIKKSLRRMQRTKLEHFTDSCTFTLLRLLSKLIKRACPKKIDLINTQNSQRTVFVELLVQCKIKLFKFSKISETIWIIMINYFD